MKPAMRHVRDFMNIMGAASTVAIQFAFAATPAVVTLQFGAYPSVVRAQGLAAGAAAVRDNITEYRLDPEDLFWGSGPYDPSNPNANIFINDGENVSTITPQDLFGGDAPDTSSTTWRNSDKGPLAVEAQTRLNNLETEVSPEGDAIRILNGSATVPDLWSDPMWTPTYEVVNQGDNLRELLGDCTLESTFVQSDSGSVFLSDPRTCRRVDFRNPPIFIANHSYNSRFLQHIAGPRNVIPCPGIEDCVDIFIGRVGNNYWCEPVCGYRTEFTEFRFLFPDAITSAVIEQATFDDYHRIAINNEVLWTGPFSAFPTECWELVGSTGNYPAASGQWRSTVNLNVVTRAASAGPPNSCYNLASETGYYRNVLTNECWEFVGSTGSYPNVDVQWRSTLNGAIQTRAASAGVPGSCFDLGSSDGYFQNQVTTPADPRTECANPATGQALTVAGHVDCSTVLAPNPAPNIVEAFQLVGALANPSRARWRSNVTGVTTTSTAFAPPGPLWWIGSTVDPWVVESGLCRNVVTGEVMINMVGGVLDCAALPNGVGTTSAYSCQRLTAITGTSLASGGVSGVWTRIDNGATVTRAAQLGPPTACFEIGAGVDPVFSRQFFAGDSLTTECINYQTGVSQVLTGHVSCAAALGPVADTPVIPPARQTQCVNLVTGAAGVQLGEVDCAATFGAVPNPPLPPNARCELSTSWNMAPMVDVRSRIVAAAGQMRFQSDTAVSGCGEGYSRLRLRYNPALFINSVWNYDADEYAELLALEADGACELTTRCTNQPTLTANGCLADSFGAVCPADLSPSPFPGINRSCRTVEIVSDCSAFSVGTYCYPDPAAASGETCISVDITEDQDCGPLEADPACGFVSRECEDGAFVGGACRVFTENWECGRAVPTTETDVENEYVCAGEIGCLGNDCVVDASVSTDSFTRAVTALEAVEQLTNDAVCDTSGATSFDDCEIFPSEPQRCREGLLGTGNFDCCDLPASVTLSDYLRTAGAAISGARAADALFFSNQGVSAFNEFMSPVYDSLSSASAYASQAFSAIQQPFVQTWNSITGQTVEVAEFAIGGVIDGVKDQILQSVAEWTLETFGPEVTGTLFVNAGTGGSAVGAAGGLSGQVALAPNLVYAMNAISLAFAAYQIAMLILAIVFECEEQEFELAAHRELRAVYYIGRYCSIDTPFTCLQRSRTYCKFNSPLSRIVMEQVVEQLDDFDWGTPENPNCPSLTFSDIDRVDWEQIDLSEWTGILTETGQMPTVDELDIESLTGETSFLGGAMDGVRLDAADRQEERGRQVDIDNIRRAAAGLDPGAATSTVDTEIETRTIACPAGFSGQINEQRTITTTTVQASYLGGPEITVDTGPWTMVSNTCVGTPTVVTDTEERFLPCELPAYIGGQIRETRTRTTTTTPVFGGTATPTVTFSAWAYDSDTCIPSVQVTNDTEFRTVSCGYPAYRNGGSRTEERTRTTTRTYTSATAFSESVSFSPWIVSSSGPNTCVVQCWRFIGGSGVNGIWTSTNGLNGPNQVIPGYSPIIGFNVTTGQSPPSSCVASAVSLTSASSAGFLWYQQTSGGNSQCWNRYTGAYRTHTGTTACHIVHGLAPPP